jgi:hypothetical protein
MNGGYAKMVSKAGHENKNRRTLLRGVCWFAIMAAIAVMFPACGGGNEAVNPPLTPAASLKGLVVFTEQVLLGPPPAYAFDGAPPEGARYGARVVDPGDKIGKVPSPKPSTMTANGEYEFGQLDEDPLKYLNLLFTVNDDLEGGSSSSTIVSINIPIALTKSFVSHLSCTVHRPAQTVIQISYSYLGPDGTRSGKLRIDFATDLLSFDLDGDGLYDDLVAIDRNHDAIPDEQAPFMENVDPDTAFDTYGLVTAVGTHTITAGGATFQVWGSTNLYNSVSDNPLVLSEIPIGGGATIHAVDWNSQKIALGVAVIPDPGKPDGGFKVEREGVIEQIDSTSLFVDGVMFGDYPSATIVDQLGQPVDPSELEVGLFVTVVGAHDGDTIKAESIVVQKQASEPQFVEREGLISALEPEDFPTKMTVDGVTFTVTDLTIIRDLSGDVFDRTYLVVGNPVRVLGHQSGDSFIADLIELKYDLAPPGVGNVEVVVIVRGADALAEAQAAIDAIDTDISVKAVVVAPPILGPDDAPCLGPVYLQLYNNNEIFILKAAEGVVDEQVWPRSENGECSILVLMDDGDPSATAWFDYAYPDGVADAPFLFDFVASKPYYGSADEYAEAENIKSQLAATLTDVAKFPYIYISSDVTFNGG